MSSLDNTSRAYLISYAVLLMVALIPIELNSQDELFLVLNDYHSSFFDQFFSLITIYGDGLTFALLIIVVAVFSYRQALLGLIIFVVTSGVAQFLKRLVC